jgi:hypothetical protein
MVYLKFGNFEKYVYSLNNICEWLNKSEINEDKNENGANKSVKTEKNSSNNSNTHGFKINNEETIQKLIKKLIINKIASFLTDTNFKDFNINLCSNFLLNLEIFDIYFQNEHQFFIILMVIGIIFALEHMGKVIVSDLYKNNIQNIIDNITLNSCGECGK